MMTKVAAIIALAVMLFTPKLDLIAGENHADISQSSNSIDLQIASIGANQNDSETIARP